MSIYLELFSEIQRGLEDLNPMNDVSNKIDKQRLRKLREADGMIEERKMKTLTNLEKVFVIVDYESFKGKCDYRFKSGGEAAEYCGTFGREELKKCSENTCPYVYAIVTEAQVECAQRPVYIQ